MDEEIRDLLGEEIKTEIRKLSSLETGSKEKSTAINDLATLYRLKIEELEFDEKRERRFMEINQSDSDIRVKRHQLEADEKDRYFRLGVELAGIILPLLFYAAWMRRGFKFEETGTYTSTTFRGLFNRFKPTRK
jgi:hypothetical protein